MLGVKFTREISPEIESQYFNLRFSFSNQSEIKHLNDKKNAIETLVDKIETLNENFIQLWKRISKIVHFITARFCKKN